MTAHTGGIRIENLRKVYGQGDTAVAMAAAGKPRANA